MTPFVADSVSHRTRLAWLAAALAASFAAFAATRPTAPPDEPAVRRELGMGRCPKARIPSVRTVTYPLDAAHPVNHLPAACVAYQDRLWRLSECDQLPISGRRALREAWNQIATSWSQLPPMQRANLAEGCRMASSALDEATTAMHCTYYDRNRVLIAGPVDR